MNLTAENYHTTQANEQYLSVSFLKGLEDCPARTFAIQNGEYDKEQTTAMLVGSYLHAAFESQEEFDKVVEENESKIKTKAGKKRAEFKQADVMIDTLKQDDFAMYMLDGEKEVILTGELYGLPFKIKVDNLNVERKMFSDIKTTADLHKRIYSRFYGDYVNWVFGYGYVLQMLVYREIIAQNYGEKFDPHIVAITKENPPNKAIITIDESHFEPEYRHLEQMIENYKQMDEPRRCERCEYCRQTKMLSGFLDVGEL